MKKKFNYLYLVVFESGVYYVEKTLKSAREKRRILYHTLKKDISYCDLLIDSICISKVICNDYHYIGGKKYVK